MTLFWLIFAHFFPPQIPNFRLRGSIRREIPEEKGVRREIPKQKSFHREILPSAGRSREIPENHVFGSCGREISRWPPGGGNAVRNYVPMGTLEVVLGQCAMRWHMRHAPCCAVGDGQPHVFGTCGSATVRSCGRGPTARPHVRNRRGCNRKPAML
jgi:hypothetical protein